MNRCCAGPLRRGLREQVEGLALCLVHKDVDKHRGPKNLLLFYLHGVNFFSQPQLDVRCRRHASQHASSPAQTTPVPSSLSLSFSLPLSLSLASHSLPWQDKDFGKLEVVTEWMEHQLVGLILGRPSDPSKHGSALEEVIEKMHTELFSTLVGSKPGETGTLSDLVEKVKVGGRERIQLADPPGLQMLVNSGKRWSRRALRVRCEEVRAAAVAAAAAKEAKEASTREDDDAELSSVPLALLRVRIRKKLPEIAISL